MQVNGRKYGDRKGNVRAFNMETFNIPLTGHGPAYTDGKIKTRMWDISLKNAK